MIVIRFIKLIYRLIVKLYYKISPKKIDKIMATKFTHSLAQLTPFNFDKSVFAFQPQYTHYNSDIFTTVGVIPSFDVFSQLGTEFYGEYNIQFVDANQFTNFNYIFDIYQLKQDVPSLKDQLGYRYNQFEMTGINAYAAGDKIKNLGRYRSSPNPSSDLGLGIFNISKVLRSHIEEGDNVINKLLEDSLTDIEITDGIIKDGVNGLKWKIEYGFDVNPGLTFSDSYFSQAYYNGVTYSLGFTFSTPHRLLPGDEVVIQMDNLALNGSYNGLCNVIEVVNPYHIVVDKFFGSDTVGEGGSVTYLLRANAIQTGNYWKYFGYGLASLNKYSPELVPGVDVSGPGVVLGNVAGTGVINYSLSGTVQRKLNKFYDNRGQLNYPGFKSGGLRKQLNINPMNDAAGLIIDEWINFNPRYNSNYNLTYSFPGVPPYYTPGGTTSVPRLFMTNWDDGSMGKKPLPFYLNNKTGEMTYPNYNLGVLLHTSYWPAYWRQFNPIKNILNPVQTFGASVSAVPNFTTIKWTLKDSSGNIKGTYQRDIDDFISRDLTTQLDWRKLEVVISNPSIWSGLSASVVSGDVFSVELIKKYFSTAYFDKSTGSEEPLNILMDFDGVEYDYSVETSPFPGAPDLDWSFTNVSPYPFHYQFENYYTPFCENFGEFRGPFGSFQSSDGGYTPWYPQSYNFKETATASGVVQGDSNWPYSDTGFGGNVGFWYSQLHFSVSDGSCDDGVIWLRTIKANELNTTFGGNGNSYVYLPEGTYSLDFSIVSATQSAPDVLGFMWGIGDEVSQAYVKNTSGATPSLYLDQELYTKGGILRFGAVMDPWPGSVIARPYKLRQKSDIVVAKKEFKCDVICTGLNAYTKPQSPYDFGWKVELMFVNRLGSYERVYFNLDSKMNLNIDRKYFNKANKINSWGEVDNWRHSKSILSQKAIEQWTINTDWLSQNELSFYEELVTSEKVWLVDYQHYDGDIGGTPYKWNLIPIILTDPQFNPKTTLRDKLFNLTVTFDVSFGTNLQNQ